MFIYIIVFIFGLLTGSFLNVCIYRIPRNISIIWPASRCPSCNVPIKFYDNIPILSYIFLGGKCRYCKNSISFRYPLVEFLNGVSYIIVINKFGIEWHSIFYFIFCSALIVITFIDFDFQIIPDRITLPGIFIGLIAGSLLLPDPFTRISYLGWKSSIIGSSIGFALYSLIAFSGSKIFKKEAMGGGDIKMMAMVGAVIGWKGVILTTFLGSLTGSVAGIVSMIIHGREKGSLIPFGPFLAFGSIISLFYGQEIVFWYLNEILR
ncbi:MAG: prepilin peptidase [Nitrospirae bacterium]|jgi:leader peptidase (prepilin peptidase)/N-methyltransferase|nr:prepilin peptidase [Nitrospirota bacterium]